MTDMFTNDQVRLFALTAAIEAVVAGNARVTADEIRWDEDCDGGMPEADRLVGITRSTDEPGMWVPLIEAATQPPPVAA